jgi:Mg-chelatase subunit ChlD
MKRSDNDASLRAARNSRFTMNIIPYIAVGGTLLGAFLPAPVAVAEEGLALAIVYDTSGSMRDPVADSGGKATPKYVIANRALTEIAKQIQAYATNSAAGAPRRVDAGLFVFDGSNAREAIPFGAFDARKIEMWARDFSKPGGSTPLGNALNAAGQKLLNSGLSRKHVLVITDGLNTSGPQPSAIMPRLKKQAEEKQTGLSVHFVAFDIDAKVFDPVKKLGATVVSAANEAQLNTQLQYILQHKILLEEEERK